MLTAHDSLSVMQGGLSMEQDTKIMFWELEKAAPGASSTEPVRVAAQRPFVMEGFGFVHDFAVTRNYYILMQPPVESDTVPYLVGQVCAASSVKWRKGGAPTLVHIVPRPGSEAER